MFELLVRLEYEREALRRRLFQSCGSSGNRYFAVGLIVFAISMLPGPLELVTVPLFGVPMALLFFLLGLILVITIILLPWGLMLW